MKSSHSASSTSISLAPTKSGGEAENKDTTGELISMEVSNINIEYRINYIYLLFSYCLLKYYRTN